MDEIFDEIYVPREVYREIVESESVRQHGKRELKQAVDQGRIQIYNVESHRLVNQLYGKLHKGELEVIIGAKELGIEYVLIDEKTARHLANDFMLYSIGTVGLLLIAKRSNKISEVRKYLDQLIINNFRIGKQMYRLALEEVGELET